MDSVKRIYKEYMKKVTAVCNMNDYEAFKEFYIKNNDFITGGMKIPNDEVLRVTMWKMQCNLKGIYPKVKKEVEGHLKEIGFSTSVDKVGSK